MDQLLMQAPSSDESEEEESAFQMQLDSSNMPIIKQKIEKVSLETYQLLLAKLNKKGFDWVLEADDSEKIGTVKA